MKWGIRSDIHMPSAMRLVMTGRYLDPRVAISEIGYCCGLDAETSDGKRRGFAR